MNTFFLSLGVLFLGLALFFLLGLLPRFARRFYPGRPGVVARAAAPLIFAGLAFACFRGAALPTLLLLVTVGSAMILRKRNHHRRKISV